MVDIAGNLDDPLNDIPRQAVTAAQQLRGLFAIDLDFLLAQFQRHAVHDPHFLHLQI